METKQFSREQLDAGYNFLDEHGLLQIFIDFEIPEEWESEKAVWCLDYLSIHRKYEVHLELKDGTRQVMVGETTDDDIKFKLSNLVGTCSCWDFAIYFYQLLKFIKSDEIPEDNSEIFKEEIEYFLVDGKCETVLKHTD